MLKFIVDESTGKSVANFLQQGRYDTIYVGEWKEGATDTEIMHKAEKEERVIVTNDKDFGELAVKEGKKAEGIILLRLKVEAPDRKVEAVENILEGHKDRITGKLVVGRENSIKIRTLE